MHAVSDSNCWSCIEQYFYTGGPKSFILIWILNAEWPCVGQVGQLHTHRLNVTFHHYLLSFLPFFRMPSPFPCLASWFNYSWSLYCQFATYLHNPVRIVPHWDKGTGAERIQLTQSYLAYLVEQNTFCGCFPQWLLLSLVFNQLVAARLILNHAW